MTSLFVTSAGTEIGKTFVTSLIVEALRRRRVAVDALKPVVSGFDIDDIANSDTACLLRALGRPVDAAAIDAVSPWRFAAPLSPDMAARREGRTIDFDALVDFCRQSTAPGIRLIEGVGGVMVPLDDRHTVLDLIETLKVPALIVVGSYLGSISHSLTALAALRNRGIAIAGIVVNESSDQPVPVAETRQTLARFVPETGFVELARDPDRTRAGAGLLGLIGPSIESFIGTVEAPAPDAPPPAGRPTEAAHYAPRRK